MATNDELRALVAKWRVRANSMWASYAGELRRCADELAAALAAQEAKPAPQPAKVEWWRPIETAPRDGRNVLLCHTGTYRPFMGRRLNGYWTDEEHAIRTPTHWMPLPAPPIPQPGDGEVGR